MDFEDLNDLPVQTQSGQALGKLESIIIDIDSQSVFQYVVKPTGIKNIFEKELLINREQITSIDKDKIVVEDGTYTAEAEKEKAQPKPEPQLQAQPIARE